MTDVNEYLEMLAVSNPLRESVLRSAIGDLALPPGSRGLDAGCGIGLQARLLAEALGPYSHVTGLDMTPEFLNYARQEAERLGLSAQISFRQGDVNRLPFENNTFDWAWSADCVGYSPRAALPALKEMVRVVRPGGKVSILFWSSQMLLPGYPILEARLNATAAGIAPFRKGMKPEDHCLRLLGWFSRTGLREVKARTFVGDVQAPLGDDMRSALIALFRMRWPGAEAELSSRDWAEYRRLTQPESADFILNLPDYYAFFTYSLFHGVVER
jgi:ubiquinone/menaquinone biosynthesis C-methylase UbiE